MRLCTRSSLPTHGLGRAYNDSCADGILCREITLLRFVLKGEGLRSSKDKVATICNYPWPTNFYELSKIGWMTTYLSHFIPAQVDHVQILKRAAILERVEEWHPRDPGKLDKNGRIVWKLRRVECWEWGEEQEESIECIKRSVVESALFVGEEDMQYHLATDTSKTGIGGILYQLINTQPGTITKPSNRKLIFFCVFALLGPLLDIPP